jgi:hypothetical protein
VGCGTDAHSVSQAVVKAVPVAEALDAILGAAMRKCCHVNRAEVFSTTV